MKKFYDNYQDPRGDAIQGATVSVFRADGTLATLYETNNPVGATRANPVTTDDLGYFWFYVPDGRYTMRFDKPGYRTQTITDVEIADIADDLADIDARIAAAISKLQLGKGDQGNPGPGVPTGGSAGQIAKKRSNADFDVIWADEQTASGFRQEVDLPIVDGFAAPNNALSNNFLLTLNTNVVLNDPVDYIPGDRIRLIFVQDVAGSHNLTFGPSYKMSGGVAPTFIKTPGTMYRLDIDITKGGVPVVTPFIIQYGSDTVTVINQGGTSEKLYTKYPWTGTAVVAAVQLDSTTLAQYQAAKAAANLGGKRLAAAQALRTAFGTAQTLTVKRDGVTVFSAGFTGQLPIINDGVNVGVTVGTYDSLSALANADLDTGEWTAVLTSGTRVLTATLGRTGKMFSLTDDTAQGNGVIPAFNFYVPRAVDGLS